MKAFMGLLMWSICLEPGPILNPLLTRLCLDFTSLMDSALVEAGHVNCLLLFSYCYSNSNVLQLNAGVGCDWCVPGWRGTTEETRDPELR